ncbi:major facilitator superfamily transporter multidrug resistance [Hypoxylon trugodes]|uniref:major facilitator superfamily transporter multidrug resistance n=1 Tax=Hypoxylon trugodes TaxID=326681 RepID=UPI002194CF9A|nr:major facilitator superfamily transporter multidrug resistance [Hypoxylon trugodes]KAI1389696.1 major facilitator superfamily transporter multidrug resistance [Hypoxylon trugodes]
MAIDLEKIDEKPEDVDKNGARTEDEDAAASITTNRGAEDKAIDAVPDHLLTPNGILVDEEAAATVPTGRARSQASSARSKPMSVVPRLKRRGFLAQLTLIPEVERSYDYPNRIKWTITLFVALAAGAAPMGSAIFYPALPEMTKDLNASPTVVNLTVAFYMLAMSIFPLWWSSFSETLGRRNIYLLSFFLNIVFSLLSGLSVNIGMLIAFRILSGGAAASVQAVGAGTIADLWEPAEKGRAMGYFYLGPLLGPSLAPIIGGALTEGFGWRSTAYFLTVYGAIVFFLVLFCVPETLTKHKPTTMIEPMNSENLTRVSTARSVRVHTQRAAATLKRCFVDPLEIIMYLRFPAVAITVYYAAVTFGSLYILNIAIQSTFSKTPYNFSAVVLGLLYLPSSLGYFAASLLGGRWIDRIMVRAAEKANRYDANGKLIYLPEDRMRENAWISATLYPGALIWTGWTMRYGVHWAAPAVANFFFGVGSMLVFGAATTMLTEFMPRRSSSGVALNNFVRNIFSCTGGIIGQPLIDAMGVGWLMTMIGLIAWISGNVCIWLLRKNSRKWREQMDKALNQ